MYPYYQPQYPQHPHYPSHGDIERRVREAMHGQQPQMQPQQPQHQPPPPQNGLACRFVGGIEEARAAQVDPMVASVFVDATNKEIHVKKIGNDGISTLETYALKTERPAEKPADYAGKIAALEKRVAELENPKPAKEPKEGGGK